MKRAPRSRQRHDLYAKYHDYDSEISDLLGECGVRTVLETCFAKALAGYGFGEPIGTEREHNAPFASSAG